MNKKYRNFLTTVLAKMCHYAQDHLSTSDITAAEREAMLECTSYQVSCFIAQNTVNGHDGCESAIVLDKLVESRLNKATNSRPAKSIEKWEKIIDNVVADFGGWKSIIQKK